MYMEAENRVNEIEAANRVNEPPHPVQEYCHKKTMRKLRIRT
jgi:hypothetical protein